MSNVPRLAELGVIHEALNVSPEDQSLWVYHSFLMLNLTSDLRRDTFAPNLTLEERVTYLTRDIEEIRELLDDYADQREIYKALVLYTLDLCRLEGHRPPDADELPDLAAWLVRLKELDPLREGLWIDLERELGLTRLGSRNECRSPSPRLARR